MLNNTSPNVLPKNTVSVPSLKQRSQKKNQFQQEEKYDLDSVLIVCNLINHLIEIDGFRSKLLLVSHSFKRQCSSGLDSLLSFAHFFFSSLTSSLDGYIDTTNGLYLKGSILHKHISIENIYRLYTFAYQY